MDQNLSRWSQDQTPNIGRQPLSTQGKISDSITNSGESPGVTSPPYILRRHTLDEIKSRFCQDAVYHGVYSHRILLWGLSGCGKRRLAAEACKELLQAESRKILWVEGRCFEAFVRDYRNAYSVVTGNALPRGPTFDSTMYNIKHALEQRSQEWLLVIFDMQYLLAQPSDDGSSPPLLNFLPNRGHLLMTTSCIIVDSNRESPTYKQLICGLEVGQVNTDIQVHGFTLDALRSYVRQGSLDSHKVDFRAFKTPSPSGSPTTSALRMALITTSIRLAGMNTSQYYQLFKFRAAELIPQKQEGDRSIVATLAVTMAIAWDIIADHDRLALKLLAYMTVVDRRGIPLTLLKELFVSSPYSDQDLNSALNLLCSSGMAEMEKLGVDEYVLNIPLLVFRWLRTKVRDSNEKLEYDHLILEWVDVLSSFLSEGSGTFNPEKCWKMITHAWTIITCISTQSISSTEILAFITNFSRFLVEDEMLPNSAGVFISQALNMCTDFQTRFPQEAAQSDVEFVRIKQVRSQAFSHIFMFRAAESELQDAKDRLEHLPPTIETQTIKREIKDAESLVLLQLDRFDEAERLLLELLEEPSETVSATTIATRQHRLTIALIARGAESAALRCSHMVMTYWLTLPAEEQWGQKDDFVLEWIERHYELLRSFGKERGAILFLSRLFENGLKTSPKAVSGIWRYAKELVDCYSWLDNIREAERLVCELMEWCPVSDIEGKRLFNFLTTLDQLGRLLRRFGRIVEAEGVFRFIFQTAEKRDVSDADGQKYPRLLALEQLVLCLFEQGKRAEARRLWDESQEEGNTQKSGDVLFGRFKTDYRSLLSIYEKTLEARKENRSTELNAVLNDPQSRHDLKRAKQLFGSPQWRLREDRDIASDINLYGIRAARSSRILHVLDRNLVYLSFAPRCLQNGELNSSDAEEIWINSSQRVLGEFWSWCACRRRRNRSQSINPVEIIEKNFRKKAEQKAQAPQKLKQKLITDWIIVTKDYRSPSCVDPSCSCAEINKKGAEEYAQLDSQLYLYKEDRPSSSIPRSRSKARYRRRKFNPNPFPNDFTFIPAPEGEKLWIHSEFAFSDFTLGHDENYIIPNAIDIPVITINGPDPTLEDPLEDPTITDVRQGDITQYFKPTLTPSKMENFEFTGHMLQRLQDILEEDEPED